MGRLSAASSSPITSSRSSGSATMKPRATRWSASTSSNSGTNTSVGRNPSPSLVKQIRALAGVELHADVPDIRPFLKHAALMAVPLRIGGGSRLKILEAAAAALPVVSTRVGSEGLAFQHGRDMLIVDDIEGMPRAILECFRAPESAAERACSALNLVRERYDWPPLAARLECVWIETATSST